MGTLRIRRWLAQAFIAVATVWAVELLIRKPSVKAIIAELILLILLNIRHLLWLEGRGIRDEREVRERILNFTRRYALVFAGANVVRTVIAGIADQNSVQGLEFALTGVFLIISGAAYLSREIYLDTSRF